MLIRVEDIDVLKTYFIANKGKSNFVVFGNEYCNVKNIKPTSVVEDMVFLYDLKNDKLTKSLNEVLENFEVSFNDKRKAISISDIPLEVVEYISNLANNKRNEINSKKKSDREEKTKRVMDSFKEVTF